MSANNYRTSVSVDPKLYFDPDICMPFYKMNIEVTVLLDPQHDGHLWPATIVESEEIMLSEEILEEIRPEISKLVQKAKPFAIHGPT